MDSGMELKSRKVSSKLFYCMLLLFFLLVEIFHFCSGRPRAGRNSGHRRASVVASGRDDRAESDDHGRDPLAVVTQHQAKGVVAVFEIDVRLACRDAESHAPAKNAAAVVRVRLQHLSRAPAWVRTCFVAAKAGNFVQRKARGARRIRDT